MVFFFKHMIYLEGTFKWPSNFNLLEGGRLVMGDLDLCKGLKIHIPFND